jgi:hypothetical protein
MPFILLIKEINTEDYLPKFLPTLNVDWSYIFSIEAIREGQKN